MNDDIKKFENLRDEKKNAKKGKYPDFKDVEYQKIIDEYKKSLANLQLEMHEIKTLIKNKTIDEGYEAFKKTSEITRSLEKKIKTTKKEYQWDDASASLKEEEKFISPKSQQSKKSAGIQVSDFTQKDQIQIQETPTKNILNNKLKLLQIELSSTKKQNETWKNEVQKLQSDLKNIKNDEKQK